eukprot:14122481-Alexandrium_andersonii.AAC.2
MVRRKSAAASAAGEATPPLDGDAIVWRLRGLARERAAASAAQAPDEVQDFVVVGLSEACASMGCSAAAVVGGIGERLLDTDCLLYTSDAADDM